jgi:hypothetical protein
MTFGQHASTDDTVEFSARLTDLRARLAELERLASIPGPDFLPLDGSDAMTGDLDMDGNNIVNAGSVNGSATGTWTPTLTNLSLGSTGSQYGRWRWSNGVFDGWWYCILGGAGISVGTTPKFSVPSGISLESGSFRVPIGEAQLLDGFTPVQGIMRLDSLTSVQVAYWSVSGSNVTAANVTSTAPHTWGSGDAIGIKVSAPASYSP